MHRIGKRDRQRNVQIRAGLRTRALPRYRVQHVGEEFRKRRGLRTALRRREIELRKYERRCFRLRRRGSDIAIALDGEGATVTVESGDPVPIMANGALTTIAAGESRRIDSVPIDRTHTDRTRTNMER